MGLEWEPKEAPLLLFGEKEASNTEWTPDLPPPPPRCTHHCSWPDETSCWGVVGWAGVFRGSVQRWSINPFQESNPYPPVWIPLKYQIWSHHLLSAGHRLQVIFKLLPIANVHNWVQAPLWKHLQRWRINAKDSRRMAFLFPLQLDVGGTPVSSLEENACSERPALAVPRLQTSFPSSTHTQPQEWMQNLSLESHHTCRGRSRPEPTHPALLTRQPIEKHYSPDPCAATACCTDAVYWKALASEESVEKGGRWGSHHWNCQSRRAKKRKKKGDNTMGEGGAAAERARVALTKI